MIKPRSGPAEGVYGISVAAQLTGTGPQNLRAYEGRGLLKPARTPGGTRLYSQNDLDTVEEITALLGQGLNLAGVEMVFSLRREISELRAELDRRDRPASGKGPF